VRRALPVALILLMLAAPSAPARSHGGRDWRPDVGAARAFAIGRAGDVSFAVRARRRLWGYRPAYGAQGVSVVKAMLMVAYLNHHRVRRRRLRASDRRLLAPMVRWSNNSTAYTVWSFVGHGGGLNRVARRARMRRFRPGAPWWASNIDAADQTRLFLRIDRLIPRRHRRYGMKLLNRIVPSQRWGIARVRPRGWTLYFKGGWGSGSGALDHQVALLRRGKRRVAVAILTRGNPSHAYAKDTLRGVARRLLRGLEIPKRSRLKR
jgi:hypothetical protein